MAGKEKTHPNEEASQRMAYGTLHEIDAIATLTGKVIPFLFRNLSYFEEGCKIIPCPSDYNFIEISPDSSLRTGEDLLFTCWSEMSLTAFHVEFNEELRNNCWQELIALYGNDNSKTPTRFRPKVQNLRVLIERFIGENVTFLGEFMSCKSLNI